MSFDIKDFYDKIDGYLKKDYLDTSEVTAIEERINQFIQASDNMAQLQDDYQKVVQGLKILSGNISKREDLQSVKDQLKQNIQTIYNKSFQPAQLENEPANIDLEYEKLHIKVMIKKNKDMSPEGLASLISKSSNGILFSPKDLVGIFKSLDKRASHEALTSLSAKSFDDLPYKPQDIVELFRSYKWQPPSPRFIVAFKFALEKASPDQAGQNAFPELEELIKAAAAIFPKELVQALPELRLNSPLIFSAMLDMEGNEPYPTLFADISRVIHQLKLNPSAINWVYTMAVREDKQNAFLIGNFRKAIEVWHDSVSDMKEERKEKITRQSEQKFLDEILSQFSLADIDENLMQFNFPLEQLKIVMNKNIAQERITDQKLYTYLHVLDKCLFEHPKEKDEILKFMATFTNPIDYLIGDMNPATIAEVFNIYLHSEVRKPFKDDALIHFLSRYLNLLRNQNSSNSFSISNTPLNDKNDLAIKEILKSFVKTYPALLNEAIRIGQLTDQEFIADLIIESGSFNLSTDWLQANVTSPQALLKIAKNLPLNLEDCEKILAHFSTFSMYGVINKDDFSKTYTEFLKLTGEKFKNLVSVGRKEDAELLWQFSKIKKRVSESRDEALKEFDPNYDLLLNRVLESDPNLIADHIREVTFSSPEALLTFFEKHQDIVLKSQRRNLYLPIKEYLSNEMASSNQEVFSQLLIHYAHFAPKELVNDIKYSLHLTNAKDLLEIFRIVRARVNPYEQKVFLKELKNLLRSAYSDSEEAVKDTAYFTDFLKLYVHSHEDEVSRDIAEYHLREPKAIADIAITALKGNRDTIESLDNYRAALDAISNQTTNAALKSECQQAWKKILLFAAEVEPLAFSTQLIHWGFDTPQIILEIGHLLIAHSNSVPSILKNIDKALEEIKSKVSQAPDSEFILQESDRVWIELLKKGALKSRNLLADIQDYKIKNKADLLEIVSNAITNPLSEWENGIMNELPNIKSAINLLTYSGDAEAIELEKNELFVKVIKSYAKDHFIEIFSNFPQLGTPGIDIFELGQIALNHKNPHAKDILDQFMQFIETISQNAQNQDEKLRIQNSVKELIQSAAKYHFDVIVTHFEKYLSHLNPSERVELLMQALDNKFDQVVSENIRRFKLEPADLWPVALKAVKQNPIVFSTYVHDYQFKEESERIKLAVLALQYYPKNVDEYETYDRFLHHYQITDPTVRFKLFLDTLDMQVEIKGPSSFDLLPEHMKYFQWMSSIPETEEEKIPDAVFESAAPFVPPELRAAFRTIQDLDRSNQIAIFGSLIWLSYTSALISLLPKSTTQPVPKYDLWHEISNYPDFFKKLSLSKAAFKVLEDPVKKENFESQFVIRNLEKEEAIKKKEQEIQAVIPNALFIKHMLLPGLILTSKQQLITDSQREPRKEEEKIQIQEEAAGHIHEKQSVGLTRKEITEKQATIKKWEQSIGLNVPPSKKEALLQGKTEEEIKEIKNKIEAAHQELDPILKAKKELKKSGLEIKQSELKIKKKAFTIPEIIQNERDIFREHKTFKALLDTLIILYDEPHLDHEEANFLLDVLFEKVGKNEIRSKLYDLQGIISCDGFQIIKDAIQKSKGMQPSLSLTPMRAQKSFNLSEIYDKTFAELLGIEGNVANVKEKYQKTFGSSQMPSAILTYAGRLKMLPENERKHLFPLLKTYIVSVFEGTFPTIRYETSKHLKLLEKIPALKKSWIENRREDLDLTKIPKLVTEEPKLDFEKMLNIVIGDKHLDPDRYPFVARYLTEKNPSIKIDLQNAINKEIREEGDLPKETYLLQLKLIELMDTQGKISLSKLNEISQLLNGLQGTEEFANDIRVFTNHLLLELNPPQPVNYEDHTIEFTDNYEDLLLCGTVIEGSCQRVDGNPKYNKCLLAYLLDGKIKLIAIKDKEGKIIARSIVRLLYDNDGKPSLMIERIYPLFVDQRLSSAINLFAIEQAKRLNVPLYIGDEQSEETSLSSLGGLDGSEQEEYVDNLKGMKKNGQYTLRNVRALYTPATPHGSVWG